MPHGHESRNRKLRPQDAEGTGNLKAMFAAMSAKKARAEETAAVALEAESVSDAEGKENEIVEERREDEDGIDEERRRDEDGINEERREDKDGIDEERRRDEDGINEERREDEDGIDEERRRDEDGIDEERRDEDDGSTMNEEEPATSSSSIDLRASALEFASSMVKRYRPWLYYDPSLKGYVCITCKRFASPWQQQKHRKFTIVGAQPLNKGKKIFEKHLTSVMHKDAVKSEQRSLEVTVIRQVQQQSREQICQNRFVIKCFLRATKFLVQRKWAHTTNFEKLIQLIAQCGSVEIRQHLAGGYQTRAVYTSPEYVDKYLHVISDHVEEENLASLRNGDGFALEADESADEADCEQLCVFARWAQSDGRQKEAFVGITHLKSSKCAMPISEEIRILLGMKGIEFRKMFWLCFDNTNTMAGPKESVQRALKHLNPHAIFIGCKSHKLALCFAHLLNPNMHPQFEFIREADATLTSLAKIFYKQPLRKGVLSDLQEMYGENVLASVMPSVTRWLSHNRACKFIIARFEIIYQALDKIYEQRKQPEVLGVRLQIVNVDFIASILLLSDVLEIVNPLTLALQSRVLNVARLPILVRSTIQQLRAYAVNLREGPNLSKLDEFQEKVRDAPSPPGYSARRLRSDTQFDVQHFERVAHDFLAALEQELKEAFENGPILESMSKVFDPQNLPRDRQELSNYGIESLGVLCDYYGRAASDTLLIDGINNTVVSDAIIDSAALQAEYVGFKFDAFELRAVHEKKIEKEVAKMPERTENERSAKEAKRSSIRAYGPSELLQDLGSMELSRVRPNLMKLLAIQAAAPVGTAEVERLFSLMKLTKTRLRCSMIERTLNYLMRIAHDAPAEDFLDAEYELLIDRLITLSPNMRMDLHLQ